MDPRTFAMPQHQNNPFAMPQASFNPQRGRQPAEGFVIHSHAASASQPADPAQPPRRMVAEPQPGAPRTDQCVLHRLHLHQLQ